MLIIRELSDLKTTLVQVYKCCANNPLRRGHFEIYCEQRLVDFALFVELLLVLFHFVFVFFFLNLIIEIEFTNFILVIVAHLYFLLKKRKLRSKSA